MNEEKRAKRQAPFILPISSFILSDTPGFPWRVRLHAKRRKTQGPTAQVQKTRCGRGIKTSAADLQAQILLLVVR
jgi:hypothetical protein